MRRKDYIIIKRRATETSRMHIVVSARSSGERGELNILLKRGVAQFG
jgi:hypothetical protein